MTIDLFSDEFFEYRMKEAEACATVLTQLLGEQVSPDFFKGAVSMMRRIISIPLDLALNGTKEQKERAVALKLQMLDAFEAKLMKKSLMEE